MMCLHRCRAAAQQIISDCLSMGEGNGSDKLHASSENAGGCDKCHRPEKADIRPASGTLVNDGGVGERRIWISTQDAPDD